MRILVSGTTGLVGSALAPRLRAAGHDVVALVRSHDPPAGAIRWDPSAGAFDHEGAEGADAIVHLAGENVASGRWTRERMRRIRDSRVVGTRLLAEGIAKLERKPHVWVGASAIGAYGDRGDEVLTEGSGFGEGFLAEVCGEWEAASDSIEALGVRRALLRISMVLAPNGGALAKLKTPFKLGLGGIVGSGSQWMSWITLEDLCLVLELALSDDSMHGIYNATAPDPVSNREFTRSLGRVLGRPTILPLPAFAARAAFGKMADALLLNSSRVIPQRLMDANHRFANPGLESALREML